MVDTQVSAAQQDILRRLMRIEAKILDVLDGVVAADSEVVRFCQRLLELETADER